MSITFACECGQALAADEHLAGRKVRCPTCSRTIPVPEPAAGEPVFESELVAADPAPKPSAKPWRKGFPGSSEPTPEEPADPNNPFGFTSPGAEAKRRDRQVQEREAQSGGGGKSFEGQVGGSGVVGGALAMLVAVVWFVGGLMADVIFFYPPVLFLIGLFAFCKGLAEGARGRG